MEIKEDIIDMIEATVEGLGGVEGSEKKIAALEKSQRLIHNLFNSVN